MRELIDTGLAVAQFPFILTDLREQLSRQRAKLVGAESVEVRGCIHANQFARTRPAFEAQLFTSLRTPTHYSTEIA